MNLDPAVALLDAFLDAEWEAVRAPYDQPDGVVAARADALREYVHDPSATAFPSLVMRRTALPPAEAARRDVGELCRRTLFVVTGHRHPLWGDLAAGVVGPARTFTAGLYDRLLYVAATDDALRIVAEYVRAGAPSTVEWEHRGGVVLDNPGPVVAVRALAEPTWPPHRDHWLALTSEAS